MHESISRQFCTGMGGRGDGMTMNPNLVAANYFFTGNKKSRHLFPDADSFQYQLLLIRNRHRNGAISNGSATNDNGLSITFEEHGDHTAKGRGH